jgi:hypothetical protein
MCPWSDFERLGGWHSPSVSAAFVFNPCQYLPRCVLGSLADNDVMPDRLQMGDDPPLIF